MDPDAWLHRSHCFRHDIHLVSHRWLMCNEFKLSAFVPFYILRWKGSETNLLVSTNVREQEESEIFGAAQPHQRLLSRLDTSCFRTH